MQYPTGFAFAMRRQGAMRNITLSLACASVLALGAMGAGSGAHAQSFYEGKTLRLIAGTAEGSGVDILARITARNLGRHIPGSPGIIVQNMPQPQAIAAANHIFNVAEPDGLTIGAASAGLFSRAISQPNIRFDLEKFTWLGNLYSATVLFWMRTDFPCQTIEALRTCSQPLKFAATARGSTGYGLVPELLKDALGLNVDIIYGYRTSGIQIALEQGEVQASGGDVIGFFGGRPLEMMKNNEVRILVQVAGQPNPDLAPYNVPWVMDVVPESHKGLFQMVNPIIDLARPYFAPPGLSAERAATLRHAFDALATDAAFNGEVRRVASIDLSYTPGLEMNTAITAMLDQPEAIKSRVVDLLTGR